ncbi:MAG: hypothetical protein ABIY55_23325, partial [Kofleriaceae bacterium]
MRPHVLLLLLASGCSLYFGQSAPGDDSPPPDARTRYPDARTSYPDARVNDGGTSWPDARPSNDGGIGFPDAPWTDAGVSVAEMARCEDGQIYLAPAYDVGLADSPGHGEGRRAGRCPGACRSAVVACADADCQNATEALCDAAASTGATCALEGNACAGSSTIECPESTSCSSGAVPGSTCACTSGHYRCKQVTPAAATQAAIVGKWRGIVTPSVFAAPYPVTLWIYPDGTYWADAPDPSKTVFYYGGDGPSPGRRITIQSTSDTVGSYADITIDFGYSPPNHGAISALVVNATTLRFSFYASWF